MKTLMKFNIFDLLEILTIGSAIGLFFCQYAGYSYFLLIIGVYFKLCSIEKQMKKECC